MTKKRKTHFKTWEQAKEEIEHALYLRAKYGGDEEMCVQSGLMLKHTISHFPSPIFQVDFHEDRKNGIEMYTINYMTSNSGESCITEWSYDPKEDHAHMVSKATIRSHFKLSAFITSQHALLGYCEDLTLHAHSLPAFEEKYAMPMNGTVLDMLYIEEYDELITCGRGFVLSWRIKLIEIGIPLELKEPPLICDVFETMEWVHSIQFEKITNSLLVLTDDSLYILSMVSRKQVLVLNNTHEASLTGCAYYPPFSYIVTAARDGTINIYNTESQMVVNRFPGHRDGTTGVATLTQQPIMVSWSKSSGSLKMWRLDTVEIINETTLSEPILELKIVRNDRLYYRSHSDLRIFEMNALFSVFCTLTGNIDSLRVCEIRRTHSNENEPKFPIGVKFSDELVVKSKLALDGKESASSKIAVGDYKNSEKKSALELDKLQEKSDQQDSKGDMASNITSGSWKDITEKEMNIGKNEIQAQTIEESLDKSNPLEITSDQTPSIPIIIVEDFDENTNDAVNKLDSLSPFNNEENKLKLPEAKHQVPVETDNTYIDHRIMCILDDRSIMTVSPLSGIILNIIFPSTELDKHCLALDVDHMGKTCYIVLEDSTMIEFDCTVNPGQIQNFTKPGKRQKVLSVVEMEITMMIDGSVKLQQVAFVGLDNGQIRLCNGGSTQIESRSNDKNGRRRSTRIGSELVPLLTMENLKAHSGQVNLLYVPSFGSLVSDGEVINNILLTSGTDWRINVWRATTVETSKPLYREIILQKMKFFHWNEMPTCIALTDNVILLGLPSGFIEMHEFLWKNLSSNMGEVSVYVDGCNSMLTGIKRMILGKELQHRKKVRSANESHQLKLFATSALDGLIKVWDTDGLLVREILLGYDDPSVCFSLGRDILATFRNHIVRIAAQDYLPNQYLLELLEMSEEKDEVEHEPELPVPMESSELEVELEEEIVFVPYKTEKVEKFGLQQRAAMLCSLIRKPKKKKGTVTVETDADEKSSDEEFVITDKSEVVKKVDLSADYVATLDRERVEKYPVAPDGIIPNSVIRDIVQSTYPNPPPDLLEFYALQHYLLGYTDGTDDMIDKNQWEEMKMLLYESSSEEECLSDESENNGDEGRKWRRVKAEREIELKRYLKGRREEGQMERKIISKASNRKKSRKEEIDIAELIKLERGRKTSIKIDLLTILLEEVSKQPWCPMKITVQNIEIGLYAVAEVLASCNSRIASQICKFIGAIFDACEKSPLNTEHYRLFPERIQRCLMHQMKDLFSFPSEHAQRSAANALIKFEVPVLKEFVMMTLMPGFFKRDMYTNITSFHTEEKQIMIAAQKVAIFANIVDLDILPRLGKLIGVKTDIDRTENERFCVRVVANALEDVGSDPIVNTAWANFILPILPENCLATTPSMEEVTYIMPDTPEKSMSLISVNVDIPEQPQKQAEQGPLRRMSTTPSNFIQQNIGRVSSSNFFILDDLARASLVSLENSIKQVSLINLPSKDQVFDYRKNEDTAEPSQRYAMPQTSINSIFVQTDNEISSGKSKPSEINITADDFNLADDIQRLSVSNFLEPISMTDTLNNIHSKSNQMLNSREKPENLRRESVGILKVMRRTSSTRSSHDFNNILTSQQDFLEAKSQQNISQHYLRGSQQHFGTNHHDIEKKKLTSLPRISVEGLVSDESEIFDDKGQGIVDILQPEDLGQMEEEIPIQLSLSSNFKNSSSSKSSSAAKRIVHLGIIASKNQAVDSDQSLESQNVLTEVQSPENLSEIDRKREETAKSSSQERQSTLPQESVRKSEEEIASIPLDHSEIKSEESSIYKDFLFRDPTHYYASRVFLELDLPDSKSNLKLKENMKKPKRKKLPAIKSESDLSKKSKAIKKQKTKSVLGIQESMGSSAFPTTVSNYTERTLSEDVVSVEQDWRDILTDMRQSRLQDDVKSKVSTDVKTKKKATVGNLLTDNGIGDDKISQSFKASSPPTKPIRTTLPGDKLTALFRPVITANILTPQGKHDSNEKLPSLFSPTILPLPRREIEPTSPIKSSPDVRHLSAGSSPLLKQSSLRRQFVRCLERSRKKNKRLCDISRPPKTERFPIYEWESKSMTFKQKGGNLPVLIG